MAEEKNLPVSEERPWISYVLGVIILVIVGFFIFGKGIPFVPKGKPTPVPSTREISVTTEAVLGQPIPGGTSFLLITTNGFTTLLYKQDIEVMKEGEGKVSVSVLQPGMTVRMEGKPNGKIFEAKKIIVLAEKKVIPTPFSLPGTGIVE